MNIKVILLILAFILFRSVLMSQEILVDDRNKFVYQFLDEMSSLKMIDYNDCIKPVSRGQVLNYLEKVKGDLESLNKRQKNDFWVLYREFAPDNEMAIDSSSFFMKKKIGWEKFGYFNGSLNVLAYKDTLVRFVINPIVGYDLYKNQNEFVYHRWNGVGAYGTIGKHLGVYANLRDNHESQVMAMDSFLTQKIGGNYKTWDLGINRNSGVDYSQILAGITYSWDWGSVGLLYDRFQWGSNNNGSNIFSGRAPAFAHIYFKMKPLSWLEVNYIHGWLNSNIIDSSSTYSFPPILGYQEREVFFNKYLAANFITFTPIKRLKLSLGNSIIYSSDNIHPAYFIPIMFYNSADQDIGNNNNFAGQNSQMYFNISSTQIKHAHIYTSVFIDEISISRMWDKSKQSNYVSLKAGIELTNLFNSNLSVQAEYTRNNPQVYKHVIPTTTFKTNGYNLGHYLGDNSDDIYLAMIYKPISRFSARIYLNNIRKGPEYDLISSTSRWGLPFMDTVLFYQNKVGINLNYFIYNNLYFNLDIFHTSTGGNTQRYISPLFEGNVLTTLFGIKWGI